jgi:hypothetical protein
MHMLFLVTAVLASHPLALEASVPAHPEGGASLRGSRSQEAKFHLLATRFDGESADNGRFTRYLAESLGGFGVGMVAGLAASGGLSPYPTLKETALPFALWVVGNGVGVKLAGWALDGRGRLSFALLGSIMGFAAPALVGTGFLLATGCDTRAIWDCGAMGPMFVGALVLTPLGAVVAYELSAPTPWLSEDYELRSPRPAPRFVPVLTLTRQGVGGTLGIAGRM